LADESKTKIESKAAEMSKDVMLAKNLNESSFADDGERRSGSVVDMASGSN